MTPKINTIYHGDCIEVMKTWPENFVDTIITDPPYGIRFMGKAWDHGVPGIPFWLEMLRIGKPGAMLLSFGGTRTFHRMTVAIEDAGWEIRDCMTWLYGSGFPKSHNLHGKFEGWGTALKPAWEPIIVAMKPIKGTFAENAETWGVAGINVDGGRINGKPRNPGFVNPTVGGRAMMATGNDKKVGYKSPSGRWPANLILDEDAAAMLDSMTQGQIHGAGAARSGGKSEQDGAGGLFSMGNHLGNGVRLGDFGGASRFFYVAKADRAERNEGCDEMPLKTSGMVSNTSGQHITRRDGGAPGPSANHHPTVKPLSLMKYLCNLTRTPTGGIVLDPFCGSGTTLWAAEFHNRPWLGIEMNSEYVAIAEARIAKESAQVKMF